MLKLFQLGLLIGEYRICHPSELHANYAILQSPKSRAKNWLKTGQIGNPHSVVW